MISQSLKWNIKKICNFHIQGNLPNIFIFSTARSGSTWLTELIAAQKGIKYIGEPLLLPRLAKGKSPIPTSWEFLLPNPNRRALLKRYFDDLINNKTGIGNKSPRSNLHNWITNRIVFKILRCKDLINWFEEEFEGQIVYLLRHPIPTNLSRERYSILPLYLENHEYCSRYLNEKTQNYCKRIIENGSELEKKVLDWCLQNLPSIKYSDRKNWLIIYYEDMVMSPEVTFNKVIKQLKLKDRKKILERYHKASSSTKKSDDDTKKFLNKKQIGIERKFLINKWRSMVNEEEEMRAFEILEKFRINVYKYGENMPDKRI